MSVMNTYIMLAYFKCLYCVLFYIYMYIILQKINLLGLCEEIY